MVEPRQVKMTKTLTVFKLPLCCLLDTVNFLTIFQSRVLTKLLLTLYTPFSDVSVRSQALGDVLSPDASRDTCILFSCQ